MVVTTNKTYANLLSHSFIDINNMADKNNILYLFDRPTEPMFVGKGDKRVSFEVPTEFLVSQIYDPIFFFFLLIIFINVDMKIKKIDLKSNKNKCSDN